MIDAPPIELTEQEIHIELVKCAASPLYFIITYCQIYDAQASDWIPFDLWPGQIKVLDSFHNNQFTIALKARQLGISWLALAYILWSMLFRAVATALIFSKRDDEAAYLLNEERLKGIYHHLPDWLKIASVTLDNVHQWGLSNGSVARAFPAQGGDSYTASIVLADEADLIPDLPRLMRSVKPTVDAGGKLLMVSRVDKTKPNSMFKTIYRHAKAGRNGWAHIFLPWWVRPERDAAWYENVSREIYARTGSHDELKEQYPATDIEALEAPTLNKRIPGHWLTACYVELDPIVNPEGAPSKVVGLTVYHLPEEGEQYVAGADCAEGLPTSDDSVTSWVNRRTGVQVAVLAGKLTPEQHADWSYAVSHWYNEARILPERNNHGHSYILWFVMSGHEKIILDGHDNRPGWNDNTLGKTLLYDGITEAAKNKIMTIHDLETHSQLGSIEASTLRAPESGNGPSMDDYADAHALAIKAMQIAPRGSSAPARFAHKGLYKGRATSGKRDQRW